MSEQHSHLLPEYGPHPQFPKSVKPGIPKLPLPKVKWQTVKIGDLFKVINDPVKMEDDQQYDLVTVKRARGGVVDRETLHGRDISVKSQFYVHEGNFLISKRQIVHGACGFVPKKLEGAIVSNEYSVLACTNLILPAFLNYLSYTPYFQQTCFHSSIGVHVEKMIFKLDEWFRWKINIPSLPEQQRIADFLSSVDAKLSKLSRKKALLEDYKRGLMQQIFSQKLRFKQDDGSELPEWRSMRLGELGSFVGGGTPSTDVAHYWKGDTPWISSSDVVESSLKQVQPTRFISDEAIRVSATKIVPRNSILIVSRVGVGKVAITESEVCTSQDFSNFTPKNGNLWFLGYLLLFNRNKLLAIGQGTSIKGFTNSDLGALYFEIPNIEEQQKIADFLSSFDQKIDVVAEQIEQLKTFKKGLLQKLFV